LVSGVAAERELQHGHARETVALPQRLHLGRDDAQVLGHDGQRPQRAVQRVEERAARPLHPLAALGGPVAARHLPVRLEPAEVVEPHQVEQRERGAEARGPPGEPVTRHRVPAVDGVAPELAGRAEVVGRHARLHERPAVGSQLEELRVRPHVRAVVGDEDGHVAHHAHALRRAARAQGGPLAEEQELRDLAVLDLARQLAAASAASASGCPRGERAVPLHPGPSAVRRLQREEVREVVEPRRVRGAERGEGQALRGDAFSRNASGRARQRRQLVVDDGAVVDAGVGTDGPAGPRRP
jgi:hypothetical protein